MGTPRGVAGGLLNEPLVIDDGHGSASGAEWRPRDIAGGGLAARLERATLVPLLEIAVLMPEGTTTVSALFITYVRSGVSRHSCPSATKKPFNARVVMKPRCQSGWNVRRHGEHRVPLRRWQRGQGRRGDVLTAVVVRRGGLDVMSHATPCAANAMLIGPTAALPRPRF